MQARRPQGAAPIAVALQPQPLQSCRSSLLSAASSPRTPCGSPRWSPIFFSSAVNRNSTDSWNSSNGPDEIEWEWKPEQVLLLTRTLDALPAHLVTPFIGPVPPSNLLDKIARGVTHAKSPVDWPHSIRATRVKLLELAKLRAKEESAQGRTSSNVSERENRFDTQIQNACTSPDKRQNIRRPLYRQNSMDFMNVAESHLDEDNITRLSNRLQRTDKPTIYDSYTRKSRLQLATGPSSPPTTPSSSTLTSLSSASFSLARSRRLRRSVSSVSTTSSMSVTSGSSAPLSVPRIQHIRADIPPPPPPKDAKSPKLGSKRAPSYGALAQGTKEARIPVTHERRDSITSCASSDEEEKVRAERTKKQRRKASVTPVPINNPGGTSPPLSSPSTPSKLVPSMPVLRESFAQNTGITTSKMPSASTSPNRKLLSRSELSQDVTSPRIRQKRLPMNLQRNPSIFGEELPQATLMSPQPSATPPATPVIPASHRNSPSTTTLLSSAQASPSPSEMRRKTLRRVRRMGNGRRISFGSLLPVTGNDNVDDNVVIADEEGSIKKISLGSAFQMH
ncbi:hypothetical protein F5887DRAFT_879407 [Amanita rubescens]|nr:hypothetical protein F5887DRAFT_879407 [Amanita rubescens]